jgi:hypothetical protein
LLKPKSTNRRPAKSVRAAAATGLWNTHAFATSSQGFFFVFVFFFFLFVLVLAENGVVGFIAGKACDCGGKAVSLGLGVEGIQGNAEGGLFRE